MASKKTFMPDIKDSKLTKTMVDLLATYFSNVTNEDGSTTQYNFTEDNTIRDMFEHLKEHYRRIYEYLFVWYNDRNGNTDEQYMNGVEIQLGYAIRKEITENTGEVKKTYKRTTKKK